MPFPNFQGRKKWWTRERVDAALKTAIKEIRGALPCSDRSWNAFKKGRLEYPPGARILEYYHSVPRAWLANGAHKRRVSLSNADWIPEEDTFLLDYAGNKTIEEMASSIGRTYQAARNRLERVLGVTARANQGYVSAAELAKEFHCPYHRIKTAMAAGLIKGFYDKKRHRWQIDLGNLGPKEVAFLREPKKTHKNEPLDVGDYDKRNNLRRKMVDGKLVRYEVKVASSSIK